ncbi:hypothetical protein LIA77_07316 [Sarocladium implicatum]|nr:hypothetical protein LIA77_07316 [Sarocladium implicatum]
MHTMQCHIAFVHIRFQHSISSRSRSISIGGPKVASTALPSLCRQLFFFFFLRFFGAASSPHPDPTFFFVSKLHLLPHFLSVNPPSFPLLSTSTSHLRIRTLPAPGSSPSPPAVAATVPITTSVRLIAAPRQTYIHALLSTSPPFGTRFATHHTTILTGVTFLYPQCLRCPSFWAQRACRAWNDASVNKPYGFWGLLATSCV